MSDLFTVIHADGGASPNPGQAAYAAILQNGDKIACVRGYVAHATNNQMELAAVIAALHCLKTTRIPVKMFVDSQYVHMGASQWLAGWKNNGWETSSGEPVKNQDLWQELDRLMSRFVITWGKVKGHAGNKMNNRADDLVQDTILAKGNPARYQLTDIPEIKCPWSYNGFVKSQLPPQAAALKKHFQEIIDGGK